jgi:hypothetical protein
VAGPGLARVQHTNEPAGQDGAAPLRRWWAWRVPLCRARLPTGGTEGRNTKRQRIQRTAYGRPTLAPIRARLLREFASESAFPP